MLCMTKTTSFIKQILNITHKSFVTNGLLDCYLGNYHKTKDVWGHSLYVVFDVSKILLTFREELMRRHDYISADLHGNELIFEFSINTDVRLKIIQPFLLGKYSEICRDYVQKNFNRVTLNSNTGKIGPSNNWKVLNKDASLKKFWENKIGVIFTEDMEVWSRPLKEEEIYGYPKQNIKLSPEDCEIYNIGC